MSNTATTMICRKDSTVLCLGIFICLYIVPQFAYLSAADPETSKLVIANATEPWQLVRTGEFARAESALAAVPEDQSPEKTVARGILNLKRGDYPQAERQLRSVFASAADSAVRGFAAQGLEALFMAQGRFAALESVAARALAEKLEADPKEHAVAKVLSSLAPITVDQKSPTTVKMSLSFTGVPKISGQVNKRKKTQDFWLDTGASMSVVSDVFVRQNGVRIVKKNVGEMSTATENKVKFHLGVIDVLQIGDLTVRNLPVAIVPQKSLTLSMPTTPKPTTFEIGPVLGWPLISQFQTTLDYPAQEVVFASLSDAGVVPGRTGAGDRNLFLLGLPCVEVTVDSSGPLLFIFDTGAQASVITDQGKAKLVNPPVASPAAGLVGGVGGAGASMISLVGPVNVKLPVRNSRIRNLWCTICP